MSNKLKLRLVLDVEYNLDGENPIELEAKLNDIVRHAMGDGWVTGDGPATVERYKHEVVHVSDREDFVAEMEKLAEDARLDSEIFDDTVHDLASTLGSEANNGGLRGQFAFLATQMGEEPLKTWIESAIARKQEGKDDDGSD